MPVSGEARTVRVGYFAALREAVGMGEEEVTTTAETPRDLYQELQDRHNLPLKSEMLRVAVNEAFGDWDQPLRDGDMVVFIPPVAGG